MLGTPACRQWNVELQAGNQQWTAWEHEAISSFLWVLLLVEGVAYEGWGSFMRKDSGRFVISGFGALRRSAPPGLCKAGQSPRNKILLFSPILFCRINSLSKATTTATTIIVIIITTSALSRSAASNNSMMLLIVGMRMTMVMMMMMMMMMITGS